MAIVLVEEVVKETLQQAVTTLQALLEERPPGEKKEPI